MGKPALSARCTTLLLAGTYLLESAVDLCAVVAVVVMVRVVAVVATASRCRPSSGEGLVRVVRLMLAHGRVVVTMRHG